MITIHESNTTTLNNLGLGALVPSLCIVKEELNGLYELELTHPYDKWGKWKNIENNKIIYVSTPIGKQAFRIYRTKPTLENITVNARHIFYDLLDNYISNLTISNKTADEVLTSINTNTAYPTSFTFETNITTSGSLTIKEVNPISAILGFDDDKDSFIKVFDGEIYRDNLTVKMLNSIGSNKGVQIRYSKNLIGLEVEEDITEVATRIYPVGKDGLIGTPVDSTHINDYPYPKITRVENSELTSQAQLTAYAQSLFNSGVDLPKLNITADFQLLSKTEEYKNFAILEDVKLGDTVKVINNKMNFSKIAKVISYEWDCLLNKYNKVELGDFVADLTQSITSGEKAINTAISASTEVKQVLNLISGNITIINNTLYICIDNTDYTQATKLFRWGINGLQYSSTGYNGTWSTIINSDGAIQNTTL